MGLKKRLFIRHPTNIPIELCRVAQSVMTKQLSNICLCGLAFKSNINWALGTIITIRIPLVDPTFETSGRVVRCQKNTSDFEIGVEFLSTNDAFKVRMIEQLCQIEEYRKKEQERALTIEEAAIEWISRNAADFPALET